jgi:hypothetical protein
MTKLETERYTKGLNFDFVVQYTARHKDITKDFEITDDILKDFADYLLENDLEFSMEAYDSVQTQIKKRLKQDISTNLWGLKEGYRVRVLTDLLVAEAVDLLKEVSVQQDLFRFAKEQ